MVDIAEWKPQTAREDTLIQEVRSLRAEGERCRLQAEEYFYQRNRFRDRCVKLSEQLREIDVIVNHIHHNQPSDHSE